MLAVCVNVAIIGCHRKGENESSPIKDTLTRRAQTVSDTIKGKNPDENSSVEIKTFRNDSVLGGFGYDIYVDNKLYVHQPHVPAVAGTKGFSSAENATKTGEFVAYKIKHNITPPSVKPEELDSLGVLK